MCRNPHSARNCWRSACARNNVAIAYLNLIGGQDDLLFDGGSVLVEPDGRVAARAPVFVDALLIAEYDSATRRFSTMDWPDEPDASREARVYAGLVRGIRDYVDKNHFPGVLLGLSGGIDSALTLALAVDALGPDRVTAVRLPSHFTSDLSNDLAEVQARTLDVELLTIPIGPPFAAALDVQSRFQPSALSPQHSSRRHRGKPAVALPRHRVDGPIEQDGRMVLSTGNKSEYAVGYATIYGDMCGAMRAVSC
jgi:NAD+ synthase (glutamine-hydrolysing)